MNARVFVYWNLHRGCWSIQSREGATYGRVIRHASHVTLVDVRMSVRESGRQRVLREGRKNVHAGLVGTLVSVDPATEPLTGTGITYNPYRAATFTSRDDSTPVHSARVAYLAGRSVTVAGIE